MSFTFCYIIFSYSCLDNTEKSAQVPRHAFHSSRTPFRRTVFVFLYRRSCSKLLLIIIHRRCCWKASLPIKF